MAHFLCDNPLIENPEGIESFIYRYPRPSYLAILREVNLLSEKSLTIEENNYNIGFLYKNPDGFLKVFFIVVVKQHDRSGAAEVSKALKETVNWYANCLRKSNPVQGTKTDGYMLVKDYNKNTPGVQVLYVPRHERYVLSFGKGITSFSDSESMFQFLHEVLGYSEEQLAINGEYTVMKI